MSSRVGQFKKGGGRITNGRKHTHQAKSKALTIVERVRVPAPTVKIIRVGNGNRQVATTKRSAAGRHHHRRSPHALMLKEHGAGEMIPGPFRLRSAGIASLLGYSDAGKGLTAVKDLLDKLPTIGKVPKKALAGLVLNYFANKNDYLDAAAQAFLDVGAYEFGQKGYELAGDEDD
jgi:hypothetical protein